MVAQPWIVNITSASDQIGTSYALPLSPWYCDRLSAAILNVLKQIVREQVTSSRH